MYLEVTFFDIQINSFVLNLIAVFKFVEPPEKPPENNEKQPDQKSKEIDQKCKVKFKIMSLKVKEGMDYIPELVSHKCNAPISDELE